MARLSAEYEEKRDFGSTPEPRRNGRGDLQHPLFVVQEHVASTHHFDLRFEIDGVLKSWVVPKGVSTDPRERRLAIHTEDHPLSYAQFEGVIPEGEYGAGAVIVWDRGAIRPLDDRTLHEQYQAGHVTVWFEGEKIYGGYTLVQAKVGGNEDHWLITKLDDDAADARRDPVSTEPHSIISGKTVGEL